MPYVIVKAESEERLHLCREPTSRSWAILIGLISLGLGAAYYGVDAILWKVAYISGAVFMGLSLIDDWEDCVFDKKAGNVKIQRQSLIQKLFRTTEGSRIVTAELDDVVAVRVEEDEVKYGTKGYMVVLQFSTGYSIGVTETPIIGNKSDYDGIADKIHKFLQLDLKHAQVGTPVSETPSTPDDNSSTSDESFEQITTDELAESVAQPEESTQHTVAEKTEEEKEEEVKEEEEKV